MEVTHMTAPIVSWYDSTNTNQVTQWSIGVVDAGSVSPDFTVLIWNNRGGASAVSDMQNCTITTKDSTGGNTGELVTNEWIEAKVVSMNETTYTPVGGTNTKAIQSSTSGAGTISGAINDGTITNAKANFAQVTLHANVPSNASAGTVSFKTRVAYQFT
jgi:hypothetical protein